MTIEQVREYWDRRPCNVRHSPVSIDEDPGRYSHMVTLRKRIAEPHTLWFADFKKWRGKRVLDYGCGIGTDTLTFRLFGAYVTALDLSGESLKIAWKRAEATLLNAGDIRFIQWNIEHPYPWMEHFDLVYSFGVIHHTPYPSRAVSVAYHALKPGGEFRLMLYHRYSTKALRILLRHLPDFLFRRKSLDEIVALESEAQSGCPVTHTYTKKTARELLESCGFEVESVEVAHIFPYKVKDYIEYRYVRAFPWNIRWFHRWLERHLGWHLLVVARKSL